MYANAQVPRKRGAVRLHQGARSVTAGAPHHGVGVIIGQAFVPRRTCGDEQEISHEYKRCKVTPEVPLDTPTDLGSNATKNLSGVLNILLADMFALYMKTKNFHWHVSGAHFRDYHLFLDDQASQIYATTDAIAERVRKVGGTTLRSIGQIARLQRVKDNDADFVTPLDMLAELRDDNLQLVSRMRETSDVCDEHRDVATASLLENWIDEAEGRVWFLYEASRRGEPGS